MLSVVFDQTLRARRALAAAAIAAASLGGCSGGGSTPSCGSAQVLSIAAFTTGATAYTGPGFVSSTQPFSSSATFLYFSVSGGPPAAGPYRPYAVTGTPILKGSDGSTLTAGPLVGLYSTHDDLTSLSGYSSSIAGLVPNVTYSISFVSLGSVTNSCRYGGEAAGSFVTD